MISNQNVSLPQIFQVDENILDKIPIFLEKNGIIPKKILTVCGHTNSSKYAEIILNSLKSLNLKIEKGNQNSVEEIIEACNKNEIDLIIGVGGGFILDVVKRASLMTSINNLLVPTIISNDGLISPISVIIGKDGKTQSLPSKMPIGVIIDINIIKNAPEKFLQAAAGDILSNISATNDWVLSSLHTKEKINDLAYMLSRSAATALIHHESKDIRNRNFLKQVIYCQINSGLAMALAGTSRPCSGSEHLLSHAIDFHEHSINCLHGFQVGSISIFSLYLQKKLDAKIINYALELNIPLAFHELDPKISENLQIIYNTALTMRPGRFTVLDMIKNSSIEEVYNEFKSFLERFKPHMK